MDMTMESCRKFVEVLASDAPAPGGGGAAALVGAIGTALGNMVGSLTVGKKKYADVEAEILALKAKCDALQKELLDQVEADEKGFVPLSRAYGIPKDDPNREAVLEEATLTAMYFLGEYPDEDTDAIVQRLLEMGYTEEEAQYGAEMAFAASSD